MQFATRLKHEYPIPFEASIFGDADLVNLTEFIELCVDDLQSDLEIYESIPATGLWTQLPKNTRAVTAVKLTARFQGNKFVKWSFDKATNMCEVRYIPAVIKYKRSITVEDLETLTGSRLQYLKAYCIEKMLSKEIAYLTSVRLESDAGSIDVTALESARSRCEATVTSMKEDIMMYSNG